MKKPVPEGTGFPVSHSGEGTGYLLSFSAFRRAMRCVRICSIWARSSELPLLVDAVDPVVPAVADPFKMDSIAAMWRITSDDDPCAP